MSNEDCRAAFSEVDAAIASGAEGSRATLIDRASPQCRCQNRSVSEHSPGPIADGEFLIRLLLPPQHVKVNKKTGEITPKHAALADAERNGLSVFREAVPDDEIRQAAIGLVSRARTRGNLDAGIAGIIIMRCSDVRTAAIPADTSPAYCVYDTATAEEPNHGEIFQRTADQEQNVLDERRKQLFATVAVGFVKTEAFRNGLLSDIAFAI